VPVAVPQAPRPEQDTGLRDRGPPPMLPAGHFWTGKGQSVAHWPSVLQDVSMHSSPYSQRWLPHSVVMA